MKNAEKVKIIIIVLLLIFFFVFFFTTARPKEPERVWIPGHYEYVRESMND